MRIFLSKFWKYVAIFSIGWIYFAYFVNNGSKMGDIEGIILLLSAFFLMVVGFLGILIWLILKIFRLLRFILQLIFLGKIQITIVDKKMILRVLLNR